MKEQLILRVGRGCNYKCKFCNVSYINEKSIATKETYKRLAEQFHKKLRVSNITNLNVTITGGEPSIFKKEVLFIVSYITRYCKKHGIIPGFEMQTNATMLDEAFIGWLVKNGVDDFLVSFHAIDKQVFNDLLGVSYDVYFQKVVSNIKLLQSKGVYISLNIILSKMNFDNYLDTIRFSLQEFPGIDIELGVVQPNGYGELNIGELYMNYEDLYKEYNKGLSLIEESRGIVTSHYCGLPLCYMDNIKHSLEASTNTGIRKEHVEKNKSLINKLNDASKGQAGTCNTCVYNNICSGIWKNYIGKQTLRPVKYMIDFFHDFSQNETAYALKNEQEDLQGLFDAGYRHILVPSDICDEKKLYKILRTLTSIGFYKISLIVNHGFELHNDIFQTGVSNIQINIAQVSVQFIEELVKFSDTYAPQFRIDMDIFIDSYDSGKFITKIEEISDLACMNFVKIFFIHTGEQSDIDEYEDIISEYYKKSSNIYTVGFLNEYSYDN